MQCSFDFASFWRFFLTLKMELVSKQYSKEIFAFPDRCVRVAPFFLLCQPPACQPWDQKDLEDPEMKQVGPQFCKFLKRFKCQKICQKLRSLFFVFLSIDFLTVAFYKNRQILSKNATRKFKVKIVLISLIYKKIIWKIIKL